MINGVNETKDSNLINSGKLLDIAMKALSIKDLDEFTSKLLPDLAEVCLASGVAVYLNVPSYQSPFLLQYGFTEKTVGEIKEMCVDQLEIASAQSNSNSGLSVESSTSPKLWLHSLLPSDSYRGMIVFAFSDDKIGSPQGWNAVRRIVSDTVRTCIEMAKCSQQISHLNAYMTVSTMLSQSLDLHQLMETILYCCMELVSAEGASILLLDDEKKNFRFYQIEGTAKSVLMKATFPADTGLAGAVLQSQEAEVINNVAGDNRFYGNIDSKSGFKTRNMIVIPLTAGEERLGVLEVINKAEDGSFSQNERMILVSIADEISLAIRNAKVFEYVANSYCKQRQGQMSCKGCQRPLGSWTPCMKYRQTEL